MTLIANKPITNPGGNPAWRKGGKSPNPAGRPRDGQSWAAVLRAVTDMPAEDLAAMVGGNQTELGRQLLVLPTGVPLKFLIVARIVSALMFEPTSGLWRAIAETEQVHDIEQRIAGLERQSKP
jgi:hypothetical protein